MKEIKKKKNETPRCEKQNGKPCIVNYIYSPIFYWLKFSFQSKYSPAEQIKSNPVKHGLKQQLTKRADFFVDLNGLYAQYLRLY